MQLFQTLAAQVAVFGPHFDVALNLIGKLIRGIITGVTSVGVGIILFSLILKVVVLPVDVAQRISMRKQNIKMEENKERMEKLQKQYANNKELYNKKVTEMYSENGLSMFSSCLPMLLSLIIFIVAINGFNAFSQYANVENYNTLVQAYNAKIVSYIPELTEENVTFYEQSSCFEIKDDQSMLYYTVYATSEDDAKSWEEKKSYIESFSNYDASEVLEKKYYVNEAVAKNNAGVQEYLGDTAGLTEDAISTKLREYFEYQGALAAKQAYEETVIGKTNFVWIKNIWVTDAMYKHPVLDYTTFSNEILNAKKFKFEIMGEECALSDVRLYTDAYEELSYQTVTKQMAEYQGQPNGYFVLIALSIATILLQQVLTNHAQKAQQKYSTVDGQGASQQKTMMVVMTFMFGFFSFYYSSAFSIYLITSNVFSMASTAIINKIVDYKDKKSKVVDTTVSGRHAHTFTKKNDK